LISHVPVKLKWTFPAKGAWTVTRGPWLEQVVLTTSSEVPVAVTMKVLGCDGEK
jgi:hypothetical protein